MGEAAVGQLPLDQNPDEGERGPDAQNDPAVPAEGGSRVEAQTFIRVRGQNQHFHEVVGAHRHDGGPEHGRGEDGEELLPLQRQHGEEHARSQERAQRDPDGGGSVELLSEQQSGQRQEEAQQQARHEEAHAPHQHGDQAAQQADAQADARAGLHAQLRVQHVLLVAQQEDDDGAEHQTGQEHDGLEAAVA